MAKQPIYTPKQIANWFLGGIDREAGDSITPLKLQKLLYYAQAWALVELKRPLFEEDFQAWAHGPVLESIFNDFRKYRWDAIPAPESVPELDAETFAHLGSILQVYGDFSAKKLEAMTHKEDPWKDARAGLKPEERSNAKISKDSMREYYSALADTVEDEE
ncbi:MULTISPECIES: Panacea domain-containing protein [Bradyrhizobium]|uniref:Panacea domain-containing protein n=1 Tax=Bradyrhizobium TaxID=374 RepID=UPI000D72FC12|nr:type II toxin-antitoxin system antitoxin SocA domain-containing protein [Bradyrhizobium diazoefficiens]AWO91946.1 SocA family protein [Bradyrhizobium diazoefficiens]